MQQRQGSFNLRLNGIMGLITVIMFFILLFFIARGIFTILAWAAPVLIIAALLINYRTVLGYIRFLWDQLRRRPLMGILGILLTVLGFPIVCGFLFGKSILDRRLSSFRKEIELRQHGELVDYEDVTEDTDVLELETPKEAPKSKNTYDDFFSDSTDRK